MGVQWERQGFAPDGKQITGGDGAVREIRQGHCFAVANMLVAECWCDSHFGPDA